MHAVTECPSPVAALYQSKFHPYPPLLLPDVTRNLTSILSNRAIDEGRLSLLLFSTTSAIALSPRCHHRRVGGSAIKRSGTKAPHVLGVQLPENVHLFERRTQAALPTPTRLSVRVVERLSVMPNLPSGLYRVVCTLQSPECDDVIDSRSLPSSTPL